MRKTVALFLAALAACQSPPAPPPGAVDPGLPSLDLHGLRAINRTLQQYIEALVLCNSPQPEDWAEAIRKYDAIPKPYQVFAEDPSLFRQMKAGSDAARKELGRRGTILQALLVFYEPYVREKWEAARRTLMGAGTGGPELLVRLLFTMLLNSQFADAWIHVRYQLVEIGDLAFETAAELARAYAQATPATPIFKHDDLTQILMALISFGDRGRARLEEFSRHANHNVRRAAARAIGESVDDGGAGILARLLAEDADWTVRAAAAQAAGRLGPSRALLGPVLVARMTREPERYVRRLVIEAIGEIHYDDAVPQLMAAIDVPSLELATAAMGSLYRITGEKFTRKDQWARWYAESYAAWKARRSR